MQCLKAVVRAFLCLCSCMCAHALTAVLYLFLPFMIVRIFSLHLFYCLSFCLSVCIYQAVPVCTVLCSRDDCETCFNIEHAPCFTGLCPGFSGSFLVGILSSSGVSVIMHHPDVRLTLQVQVGVSPPPPIPLVLSSCFMVQGEERGDQ